MLVAAADVGSPTNMGWACSSGHLGCGNPAELVVIIAEQLQRGGEEYHHSGNLRMEAVEGKPSLDPQTGKRSPEEFAVSAMTKPLFATVAMLAIASNAPALAQDPHAHDVSAQAAPTAAPVECPAGAAGMASHPMPGMGSGGMQQNMGNMQQMQMMQQMQQTMLQMHTDMQQMHSEMMQMRQQMQHRRGSAKYTRQSG